MAKPSSGRTPRRPNGERHFVVRLTKNAQRDLKDFPPDAFAIAFSRLARDPLPDGRYKIEATNPPWQLLPGERFCRWGYDLVVIDYSVFEQLLHVFVHRIKRIPMM